jgi:hypothetical protein
MFTRKAIYVVLVILLYAGACAQDTTVSPYDILNKYFRATGGLDQLKAEQSQYIEGNLSLGGLNGTLKSWTLKPGRTRTEADLGVFKITQADNGDYEWVLDSNGKLQKITSFSDAAIKRKKVKRLIAEYEYADPKSEIFQVAYDGTEDVDSVKCHVIRISNNTNNDVLTYFINTQNYLLEKSISIEGEESNDTYYGDYRKVDGLMVAFWTKQIPHQTGQPQELTLTEYVSNPEIDPAVFEPPAESAKDYHFADGDSAVNIPIRFIENHIYVPVTIDCRETFWVLDTGAAISVVGEEFAKNLGLEPEGDLKGVGSGGTVTIKFVTLPSYSLPGVAFDRQTVATIDLKELNRMLPVEITGILGYDFLSRFVTKIDFANENISVYEPEAFSYDSDGHQVPLHLKNNVFVVDATLDGEHSGSWLFDLGASTTSLNSVYAHINKFGQQKGTIGLGRGAGNYFTKKIIKCSSLDFADFTVNDPFVGFSFGGTDTVMTSDEIGTLGNSLFKHFIIYCDYTGERLILEEGVDFNKEFPYNRSGLQLARGDNDQYEVLYVSENTPARDAGFLEGDIIKEINGIKADCFDGISAIRKLLQAEAGAKYTFAIERNGELKKLKLKLKDLL